MRLRFLPIAVLLVGIFSIATAAPDPVTEHSTTAWNVVDLQPAKSHPAALVQIAESEQPPDNGSGLETAPPHQSAPQQPVTMSVNSDEQATLPATPPESQEPQTQATTALAGDQAPVTDSAAQPEAPPQIIPGTIIITSIPDTVAIVINDVSVGSTPYFAAGFYPGIYEVVLHLKGYQPFVKQIELKDNGTEFVTGVLVQERGALFISSLPDSANVQINDSAVGVTPFASQPLLPGTYRLRVEAEGHSPYTEQLTITPELTDTLQITLVPLEKPKLTWLPADLKNSQTMRRITFGSIGAAGLLGGFILNAVTKQKLTKENDALASYQEARHDEATYAQRYADYLSSAKTTDRVATGRNILYTIGIISGLGFAVSIPF